MQYNKWYSLPLLRPHLCHINAKLAVCKSNPQCCLQQAGFVSLMDAVDIEGNVIEWDEGLQRALHQFCKEHIGRWLAIYFSPRSDKNRRRRFPSTCKVFCPTWCLNFWCNKMRTFRIGGKLSPSLFQFSPTTCMETDSGRSPIRS
jgi:hypothetical protein